MTRQLNHAISLTDRSYLRVNLLIVFHRLARYMRCMKKETKLHKQNDSSDDEDRRGSENNDVGMMEKLEADLKKQKLKMKCIQESVDELKHLVKGIALAVHAGNSNDGGSIADELSLGTAADQPESGNFISSMVNELFNPSQDET